ncbi:terminase [Xenorhabdus sp. TS4]|uniref:Terminase n=1 Tax=Xenorhabdus ehlersii TaxID=290111 RepID=A0A2D0IZ48_9GAMM|nr:terminase [Xenorhabdus sp. TS4]PHM27174.1 terminase [Xenorhabdus ehlersii]
MHDTIQKARGIPSQWTEMLTKRFNIWCQGETPWMGETDANANIKPNKKKLANKADPAIAFLMSFGTWQAEHEEFAFTLSTGQQRRLDSFGGV